MVSNRGSLIVLRCGAMKRLRRFSVATHNHLISLVGRYNHWIRMGMAPRECVVSVRGGEEENDNQKLLIRGLRLFRRNNVALKGRN